MEQQTTIAMEKVTETKAMQHLITLTGNCENFSWTIDKQEDLRSKYEYCKNYKLDFFEAVEGEEPTSTDVTLTIETNLCANADMEEITIEILATDMDKCNAYIITKYIQSLLQNTAMEIHEDEHSEEKQSSMYPLAVANMMIYTYFHLIPQENQEEEIIEEA